MLLVEVQTDSFRRQFSSIYQKLTLRPSKFTVKPCPQIDKSKQSTVFDGQKPFIMLHLYKHLKFFRKKAKNREKY